MRKSLEAILKADYGVKGELLKRYADILTNRAIRFYMDSNLDAGVVEEDMYTEDGGKTRPNLDYSEEQDAKREAEDIKLIAKYSK